MALPPPSADRGRQAFNELLYFNCVFLYTWQPNDPFDKILGRISGEAEYDYLATLGRMDREMLARVVSVPERNDPGRAASIY